MLELYKTLMAAREDDSKRLWVLFGLMNVINGGLLAFVTTNKLQPGISRVLVICLGMIMSFIWFSVSRRIAEFIKWWESKLIEIEPYVFQTLTNQNQQDTGLPPDFCIFVKRELPRKIGLSTKYASQFIPLLFLFAWAGLLVEQGVIFTMKIYAVFLFPCVM